MRARSASGSVDSPSAVEPTRSQKRTVTTLRCSRMPRESSERTGMELGELDVRGERRRVRGIEAAGADLAHRRSARGDRGADRVVGRALVSDRGEELREQDVARARRRTPGPTCGANARIRRVFRPTRMSAKQPFSSVMRTLRAPISAIASSAMRKSSSSSSSWPTSCSASRWFGETRNGPASTPRRSGSPSRVEDDADVAAREVANRVRVERRRDLARQRARQHDEVGAAREVVELLDERLELDRADLGAPLVDLGVGARRRIDDRGRRPRLGGDPDEVVEDRLGGELLDDPRPGPAAGEPGRDHGHVEDLQRAGDVDALAAREREHLARAVAEADLEHRHGQRPVERRVRRHGDDHVTIPQRLRRGLGRVPLRLREETRPRRPPRRRRGSTPRRAGCRRRPRPGRDALPSPRAARATSARRRARRAASRSGRRRTIVRGATSSTSGCPYPVSASAYTRDRGRSTCTRRYWSRPYARSSRSASLRAAARVAPEHGSVHRRRRASAAAAACDQPASRVCPVFPPTSGAQLLEQVVGRREGAARPGATTLERDSASRMNGTPSA